MKLLGQFFQLIICLTEKHSSSSLLCCHISQLGLCTSGLECDGLPHATEAPPLGGPAPRVEPGLDLVLDVRAVLAPPPVRLPGVEQLRHLGCGERLVSAGVLEQALLLLVCPTGPNIWNIGLNMTCFGQHNCDLQN